MLVMNRAEVERREIARDKRITDSEIKRMWENGEITQAEYIAHRQGKIVDILENIKR